MELKKEKNFIRSNKNSLWIITKENEQFLSKIEKRRKKFRESKKKKKKFY
jgi:hypothetical protein